VRGKKNLVLEKDLAGPIGNFVKFSTLQDYGEDKVFFLENENADTSQRNVVFIARGESARHTQSIAGMYHILSTLIQSHSFNESSISPHDFKVLDVLSYAIPVKLGRRLPGHKS